MNCIGEEGLLPLAPIYTDQNSRQRIDVQQSLLNKCLGGGVKPIYAMLLCFFPRDTHVGV